MARFNKATPFLGTRDIQRAIDFYTGVLGFRIETLDSPDAPTFCILDNGDVSIIFDATLWPEQPRMTGQIHFNVAGIDELYKQVKTTTGILWGPETFDYGKREFSCKDPHGYALVFSESTRLTSSNSV